jgi:hypothetical protein
LLLDGDLVVDPPGKLSQSGTVVVWAYLLSDSVDRSLLVVRFVGHYHTLNVIILICVGASQSQSHSLSHSL